MRSRHLAIGLSALTALAFGAGIASAGDTVRLSLPAGQSAPTLDLKATPADLAADTVATHLVRGAFRGAARGIGFAVGHRGYYGGYRGYYGGYRGYYGGYRGYYGPRFYGGYYGSPFYGPRFYGGYYGPRFYGGYYGSPFSGSYYFGSPLYGSYYGSSYYSDPCYSGYAPIMTYPISNSGAVVTAQTTVLRPAASANYERPLPMPYADEQPPAAPAQPGTFPYDGGPQRQIPVPPLEESPVRHPDRSKPAVVEDLVVKMPGKASGKWTYPAYGEKPSR